MKDTFTETEINELWSAQSSEGYVIVGEEYYILSKAEDGVILTPCSVFDLIDPKTGKKASYIATYKD